MLSLKTCIELISVLDKKTEQVIDRIFVTFDLEYLIKPIQGRFNIDDKVNILLKKLINPPEKGIFSDSFSMDLLQYIVDLFYRQENEFETPRYLVYKGNSSIEYEDLFLLNTNR